MTEAIVIVGFVGLLVAVALGLCWIDDRLRKDWRGESNSRPIR